MKFEAWTLLQCLSIGSISLEDQSIMMDLNFYHLYRLQLPQPQLFPLESPQIKLNNHWKMTLILQIILDPQTHPYSFSEKIDYDKEHKEVKTKKVEENDDNQAQELHHQTNRI